MIRARRLSFLRVAASSNTAVMMRDTADNWRMLPVAPGQQAEPGLVVFWFGADLYYASANHFCEQARALVHDSPAKVNWLVIDAGAITGVDYSAAGALADLHDELAKKGVRLALAHVSSALREDLDRLALTRTFGSDMLFDTRLGRSHRFSSAGSRLARAAVKKEKRGNGTESEQGKRAQTFHGHLRRRVSSWIE